MGIFLTPLMDEFGFGRTKASSILGVLTFMPLVSVITTDALYKKFPIKPCICAFVLGMAIGMFMLSKSTNLIQCYISVILVGYCLGSAGMISVTTLINRWFYEKRGLAIGIVTSSSGLANMIMPNIMINFIELYGVRTAIGIHSVLMLCVGILALILISDSPEKKKANMYGLKDNKILTSDVNNKPCGISFRRIIIFKEYWILSISCFVLGGSLYAVISHYTSFLIIHGHSMQMAANLFSIYGFFMLIGKLLWGKAFDILKEKKGTVLIFISWIVGLIAMLFLNQNVITGIVMAVLIGLGSAIGIICLPLWINAIFSEYNYTNVYTWVAVIQSIGVAVYVVFFGFIEETMGSYKPAVVITIILSLGALLGIMWCLKRSKRKMV